MQALPTEEELPNKLEELAANTAATPAVIPWKGVGDAQDAYLKALDTTGNLGPDTRPHNVCRARTGKARVGNRQCCCGLTFPNAL